MSESSTSRAYPLLVTLHTIEPGALNEAGYPTQVAIATQVMRLWCFKHGANHQIRITDVERIVYLLIRELADGDQHDQVECPLDIAVLSREIGYADLIERGVESRSQVDACWQE